ncbi:subtilase family protein [Streptomyces sp. Ag109_O5-1]|uniref:S8 family serine peptidase n=1 Tax=Streptomyces sp. Ag109_O5-1 TaxID=1938851 RepID=UPI000F4ED30A|nr:S8 family serine peptidase [Streptomyces sp. Ag109_O5-1]RPE38557.1 subtilase family protein [Streptomyces sp. Ag109_O5-1]
MLHARPPALRLLCACAVLALTVAGTAGALPASAASPTSSTSLGDTPATQASPTPDKQRHGVVPGQILVTLDQQTSVTGPLLHGTRIAARTPQTNRAALNAEFRAIGATSLHPLVQGDDAGLSRTYVLTTGRRDSTAVARSLRGTQGIADAEPDRYVNTMNTGARPLPSTAIGSFPAAARTDSARTSKATASADAVPANAALTTSAQAFLNSGGVDAIGAFSLLQSRYGQQPGTGETITNVSIGDLTDQSMADAGDSYVQANGPTTVLKDGQRYLDLPSMPLIPTYVAEDSGGLDGAASTEQQDPSLDEVLLDFSVMAPLAHDRQRPEATGSGYTDLLGIAPGADYRLVVPQQPTTDRIAGALLAAAHQSPKPDVITASLGFGTDADGYAGRYLEDDPVIRSVVTSIVHDDGIVVSISSNDGTRLYTPASIGPDGGSTPTDLAPDSRSATTIADDAESTTPSRVPDSGAIAAGGSTLDDTLAAGARGDATTAETRLSGFGTFSSGFGSRVDLSAPSDNILAFTHPSRGTAQDVDVSLNGGTSASAPEIAAAAAVVLQAGRLGGHRLTPAQVRDILEKTGRTVSTPPQIDRTLHIGPQVDVTAAAEKALGRHSGSPSLVRLSVAHRVTIGDLGGAFTETTDPGRIDLGDRSAGGNGEGLVGPVTFAGDTTGVPDHARYTLTVGSTVFRSADPAIRVTPAQLLTAAGLPLTSATDRQITVTYRVLVQGRTRASTTRTLAIGPSDGTYAEATAPKAPATVAAGHPVTVSYDLTGVASVSAPQLVVSTVGHWNPSLAPIFTAGWHQALTAAKGTVTIPAQAFANGGGLYGIGIAQKGFGGKPTSVAYGEFAPIRVDGGTAADRPAAPVLTGAGGVAGHVAEVSRAASGFTLRYDVRNVRGAQAAEVEFSAPAPTLHGTYNTFTNANGTQLDHDGVNTPSVFHRRLSVTSGSVRLDAAALGLGSSDSYNVRVLALGRDGQVVGQASPLSTLAFDDGIAPDYAWVQSFAAAGSRSVAALVTASGGTEVRHYSTATGNYGDVITSDPGSGSSYEVVGATANRVLLVHRASADGDARVETWNTTTDSLTGVTVLPAAKYSYLTGRVDTVHGRGALLLHGADKTDLVLPVDLGAGSTGDPIAADPSGVAAGTYTLLTVDSSTGNVFLAKSAGPYNCLGGITPARIDLTARTVTGFGSTSACSHGIASNEAGSLINLSAAVPSINIVPTGALGPLDEKTGEAGDFITLRLGKPSALAVDGTHRIAVVSYTTPAGTAYFGSGMWVPDNNATGQLAVVDLTTGTVVRTLTGFAIGSHGGAENALQLDPRTRTGWTYGPGDQQIQQFSY